MENLKNEKSELLDTFITTFSDIEGFAASTRDIEKDLARSKSELSELILWLSYLYARERDEEISSQYKNLIEKVKKIEEDMADITKRIYYMVDDMFDIYSQLSDNFEKKLNEII